MKVVLRTSGGFANIRIEGELDTDELPLDTAERAESLLHPESLRRAASSGAPRVPDAQQYTIWVEGEEFTIDQASAEPRLRALMNDLTNEIIRRRKGAP